MEAGRIRAEIKRQKEAEAAKELEINNRPQKVTICDLKERIKQ